jgi:LPS sulfotransferase NodH
MSLLTADVHRSMQAGTASPVFILGLHRSGTTWLYEMLAQSGHFDVLTATHVIYYDKCRADPAVHTACRRQLQERFEQLGLTSRGTEAVRLGPDTPEEYGFVLDNHGVGVRLTRKNLPLFQQMLRAIRSTPDAHRRPLLKNPWDFSNACLIKQLLPDAKFIFIHRNPFHVISSMYRLAVSSIRQPEPYTAMLHRRYHRLSRGWLRRRVADRAIEWAPGLLVRGLLAWVQRSTTGYLRNWPLIPPADRCDVTYEQLCQDPNASVEAILRRLGIQAGACDYRPGIAPRGPRVAEPIATRRDLVIRKLHDYAAAVGYDLRALASQL